MSRVVRVSASESRGAGAGESRPGSPRATGRFRRQHRLLDSRDFRRVMRRGRRRAGSEVVVVFARREPPPSAKRSKKSSEIRRLDSSGENRLGITVSRKVGNAVCRNRFKRRVRAWFRMRRDELAEAVGEPAIDLIVMARRGGGELGWTELDQRLSTLLGLEPLSR